MTSKKGQVGRPRGSTNKWTVLYGSKTVIASALGLKLPTPPVSAADDILRGAKAVAEYSGLKPSTVYAKAAALGLRRLGGGDGE
jgi:hypothetical protein